jgi:Raf kinase inhibitor-like YbhB/YbcL family protein
MKNYFYFCITLLLIISCSGKKDTEQKTNETKQTTNSTKQQNTMDIKITSSAFEEGGMIPSKYTCDGENISPPLSWSGAPSETKSFALINDDPDAPAGTWVHWVIYNIPGTEKGLKESLPVKKNLDDGTVQGLNDFRKTGYGGPCPPGGTHRYYFKLYALDVTLNIDGDATKDKLLEAMKGHILAEGQLMGKYSRK